MPTGGHLFTAMPRCCHAAYSRCNGCCHVRGTDVPNTNMHQQLPADKHCMQVLYQQAHGLSQNLLHRCCVLAGPILASTRLAHLATAAWAQLAPGLAVHLPQPTLPRFSSEYAQMASKVTLEAS